MCENIHTLCSRRPEGCLGAGIIGICGCLMWVLGFSPQSSLQQYKYSYLLSHLSTPKLVILKSTLKYVREVQTFNEKSYIWPFIKAVTVSRRCKLDRQSFLLEIFRLAPLENVNRILRITRIEIQFSGKDLIQHL